MKGRTQIIQNTQLCCVEHKKGEGFFFTDKIIVFRAQKSRRVLVKALSRRGKRRGEAWVRRDQPDLLHPGYLCICPGKEQPAHQQLPGEMHLRGLRSIPQQ